MKVVSKLPKDIALCLDYLNRIISERIRSSQIKSGFSLIRYKTKTIENSLERILQISFSLSFEEKLILFLAISPYVKPGFLDDILTRELPEEGNLKKSFGGIKVKQYNGLLPTAETALFLLAGNSLSQRLKYQKIFENDEVLTFIKIQRVPNGKILMNAPLFPDPAWLEKIFLNIEITPSFPVQKISTSLKWEDLVLPPKTREKIDEIENWLSRWQKVLKDPTLERKEKPRFKTLFHGPSGSGKTLSAALLGKKFNIPVYTIDLSLVVSKYIGETEKNLVILFSKAREKNLILFFDEADALFGKRTAVKDSHDRYANQEVSYLLQKMVDFEGLLILSARLKGNIDDAFIRRFDNIIPFPKPGPAQRLKLRQKNISEQLIAKNLEWKSVAEKFEGTRAGSGNAMQDPDRKDSGVGDKLLKEDIDKKGH